MTSLVHASPHTIAAYRDTFRLLLQFAQKQVGKQPSTLGLEDLDAPLVGAFLDHLEEQRGDPRLHARGQGRNGARDLRLR